MCLGVNYDLTVDDWSLMWSKGIDGDRRVLMGIEGLFSDGRTRMCDRL